jgi:hypothetical protein
MIDQPGMAVDEILDRGAVGPIEPGRRHAGMPRSGMDGGW